LFVRAGGKCALCRQQTDIVSHVAAPKEVDERGPDADFH
jgi:hypothetical protein